MDRAEINKRQNVEDQSKFTSGLSSTEVITNVTERRVLTACVKSLRERETRGSQVERRPESFVRAPEQIYFLSRSVASLARRTPRFSVVQLRYRFAPASGTARAGSRVFIDDTFRPERFKLSLFWQVSLRFSCSGLSFSLSPPLCPDLQSGRSGGQLKSHHRTERMTVAPDFRRGYFCAASLRFC